MSSTYEEKYKRMQDNLLGAYHTYLTWRILQNEQNLDLYNRNSGFWTPVLIALQEAWFMGLARLYEDSRYSRDQKVIAVESLIQQHPDQARADRARAFLRQNAVAIENINRIRDKRYAHSDADFLDPKVLMERFPLSNDEIKEIFQFSADLLSILHPEDGNGFVLSNIENDAEIHAKDVVEGLRYFHSARDNHRERWVRGEVNDFNLPPISNGQPQD